jgi:putative 4-mercaptohistidine N1-methyltranferase
MGTPEFMHPPDFYQTDRALSEYLLFHYGSAAEVLPWSFGPATALNYPVRCVSECLDVGRVPPRARALDLGCAVGRATFELARHCAAVVGVDYSHRFIAAARQLQERGSIPYSYVEEGSLTTQTTAVVPAEIDRGRVTFEQGDAHALPATLGEFDVVLLLNLVDRLRDPRQCLSSLPALVRPGGQVILTTPCTWLEDYTARTHWLGGFAQNGRPVRTLDGLQALLHPHFSLARSLDLPFLLREHARKFQWSVALATLWFRQ